MHHTHRSVVRQACLVLVLASAMWAMPSQAHHILGRPSYGLNEDSNTPPSIEVEAELGDYTIRYMAFPAFPRAGEAGRVNFYAKRSSDGRPFDGVVRFSARDDTWFGGESAPLGEQLPDDHVFRQGFRFGEDGNYLITAEFEDHGVPYRIDLPLRVGRALPVGPVGLAAGLVVVLLLGVSIVQRRRLLRGKIRSAREAARS